MITEEILFTARRDIREALYAYRDTPRYSAPYANGEPFAKIPANKGVKGKNCNRQACQSPRADWYNTSTRAYYCCVCAHDINLANIAESLKLEGHPFLCVSPLDTERYPK